MTRSMNPLRSAGVLLHQLGQTNTRCCAQAIGVRAHARSFSKDFQNDAHLHDLPPCYSVFAAHERQRQADPTLMANRANGLRFDWNRTQDGASRLWPFNRCRPTPRQCMRRGLTRQRTTFSTSPGVPELAKNIPSDFPALLPVVCPGSHSPERSARGIGAAPVNRKLVLDAAGQAMH